MPLLKGASSKSTPRKAIGYITNPKKAAYVSVRNLFEDEDYAGQFEETAALFGKGRKYGERKYYHFKLSCARSDNIDPHAAQLYAEELAARLFKDCECVIATHTDTQTVHSHIIVNAVNPLTGKKLHITEKEYGKMKDEANRLGVELGYSYTEYRKTAKNKRTSEEKHIILKGGTSWKEDLREVIEEAKEVAKSEEEFIAHLRKYGVRLTRNGKDYSYLHPEKQKAVRGLKLGENYTKSEVLNVISKQRNGRTGNAAQGTATAESREESGIGKRVTQRSVGDIEREMWRLDRAAEYAHIGLDGESEEFRVREREVRDRLEREQRERNERTAADIEKRAGLQRQAEREAERKRNQNSK